MKIIFSVIFQMLTLFVFSQKENVLINHNSANKLKVKIKNFSSRPPDCGIVAYVAVYSATVLQPKFVYSKDILIYVYCREGFGNVLSKDYTYNISLKKGAPGPSNVTIINYSGKDLDSMVNNKYTLLSIKPD